jgi:IS30 family transposase
MLFKQELGQNNVTSLVERVSRFTVILKTPTSAPSRSCSARQAIVQQSAERGKIMSAIKDLPLAAPRSITFDGGTEFVSWPHLQAEIGTQAWFCDPSSPSRDIAMRYPAGRRMAKRHSQEHEPKPSKVASSQTRHPAMHRSRYEGDM